MRLVIACTGKVCNTKSNCDIGMQATLIPSTLQKWQRFAVITDRTQGAAPVKVDEPNVDPCFCSLFKLSNLARVVATHRKGSCQAQTPRELVRLRQSACFPKVLLRELVIAFAVRKNPEHFLKAGIVRIKLLRLLANSPDFTHAIQINCFSMPLTA